MIATNQSKSRIRSITTQIAILLTFVIPGCGDRSHVANDNEIVARAEYPPEIVGKDGAYHVYPGNDIQRSLDLAADDPNHKLVRVHAGTYRPSEQAQALIYLNRRHDGISLEAVGEVILTAANPNVGDKNELGYPAIVNHVVFFGDGISQGTILRGFNITGANGFLASAGSGEQIEQDLTTLPIKPGLFFYSDGGAIKIFGRSYPTIENIVAHGNSTNLCGGAVSVEHGGFNQQEVTFRNCVFRDNHCPATGSAIDLLPGSAAKIENCLLVRNISNTGMNDVKQRFGLTHNEVHGCGALTVFENSKVNVDRCTFTENWNGVDDRGKQNTYRDCIFWMNDASDGSRPGAPYELDIVDGAKVSGCFIHGTNDDLRGTIDTNSNSMQAPDPQFDESYRPTNDVYNGVGFRPKNGRPR